MNKTKPFNGFELSEGFYKTVLNSLKLGIVTIDAETLRIVQINPFMTELSGYGEHHFLGKELWATRLFENEELSQRLVEDLKEAGFLEEITLQLRTARNGKLFAALTGTVIGDQHRKFIQCSFRELNGREEIEKERNLRVPESKKTEEAARSSRDLLALAMATADLFSWEIDAATNETVWSENAADALGLSSASMPTTLAESLALVHPEDAARVRQEFDEALSGKRGELAFEFRIINPADGSIVWIKSRGVAESVAAGRPARIVGVSQNVTAGREAEEKLLKSTKQTAFVTDTAPVYIAHLDTEQRFKFVNRPYAARFGLKPADCVGRRLDEILGRDAYLSLQKYVEIALSGRAVEFEVEIPYASIGKHFMHCSYVPEFDEKQNVIGFVAANTDISERRKIEESLRETQEEYEALVKTSAQIIWETNAEGAFEKDSPAWAEFTGKTFEERYGFGWINIVHPDDRQLASDVWVKALREKTPMQMEIRLQHHSGEWRWTLVRATPVFNTDGSVRKWVGMNTDITARKEAEEITRKANERFELVAKATNDVVWDWNLETDETWWSESIYSLFGHNPEEVNADPNWWNRHVHPEDLQRVTESFESALESGARSWSEEYRFQRADGTYAEVLDRGYLMRDGDGKAARAVGAILDITERRESEQRLRKSEERLRLALEGAQAGVWEHSFKLNFLYTSRQVREMFGFREDEELTQEMWQSRIHPEDRLPLLEKMLEALKSDARGWRLEFRVLHPTRGVRWIQNLASMTRDRHGWVERVVGINLDITEVKTAEDRLRASEERLRFVLEGAQAGVIEVTFDPPSVYQSEQFHRLYGFEGGGVMPEDVWRGLIHPYDLPVVLENLERALAGEMSEWRQEFRIQHPTRGERWIQDFARVRRDINGRPLSFGGIHLDITELKLAERELRRSEAAFRTISNAVPSFVWSCDPEGRLIYMNERWSEFTGQPVEEAIGYGWVQKMHPEDAARVLPLWEACRETGEIYESEGRYLRRDGEYRWHKFRALPQRNAKGEIEAWYGSSFDIHDVKMAEEKIRESEARFRRMADNAPVMVWVTDPRGDCNFISQSWCEFTGQTAETELGYGWTEALHPDDAERVKEAFEAANQKHEALTLEYRLRRKNGEYRWMLDSAQPRFSDAGEFLGYIGSVLDITERKLMEEKLRESEENFRALVEATTQAVWEAGSEEKERALIDWWIELTGVSPEKARNWFEVIHPDDRQKVAAAWQEADEQKTVFTAEYRVRNRFGNYLHFAVRGVPVFNGDGSFRQWIGTFTDITRRKEMEQALLESEARYRVVAETASDAIVTIDEQSRILFVNPAAEQIFGYRREELENRSLLMLMPENMRQRHVESLSQYIAKDQKHIPWRGVEVPAVRKDGGVITIEISFGEYREEGKHVFTGIVRDVTHRKKTAERLRRSEERYRLLFQDNPLPMWVYDLETLKFLAVNEAACSHYGYTQEEFLSMTIKDIRPAEDVKALLDDVQKTNQKLNNAGVWRHRKKDGSIIYVEINSHYINFDGADARLILAMDVTERQEAEEEVRKLNESLEEKVVERTIKLEAINKELESFSYSVSHDLRAPLRAMDGFSFALLEDYSDLLDEEGKHYLTRIRAASQKMAQLIDDMLKLSRVSRGEITRREVNLSALVRDVADHLQEMQPRTGVTLNIQENVTTLGDEHLLRIALENLLGNAWKFTSKKEDAIISFGEKKIDGETVYFVSDNGAGFDMTYAGKLFGAFQRLHTTREFEGTGIGLATVQRIINRHGGRIWAEGKPDEGATFYFKL